jgi:hypothetical protein
MLKFCYDKKLGIYYQEFFDGIWTEIKVAYKECFNNFYVFQVQEECIYILCQDICGDIILCTLENKECKKRVLLHMRQNIITPLYIRAFVCMDSFHLLYSLIDRYNKYELLIHQNLINNTKWSTPRILTSLDDYNTAPFYMTQDNNSTLLLYTSFSDTHKLIVRKFYGAENRWEKEVTVYESDLPYLDYSLIYESNRIHYLFITQEEKINKVIYGFSEEENFNNFEMFCEKRIESCLLLLRNKVLWILWVCDYKLYGCYSLDNGKSFSEPIIYGCFETSLPIKIFYQEFLENNENYFALNQTYVMNSNVIGQFFLEKLLDTIPMSELTEEEYIENILEDKNCSINELKEHLRNLYKRVEILKTEKSEIELALKNSKGEITNLTEAFEKKENEISFFREELKTQKDKEKFYLKDNKKLKEENNSLEQKLIEKNREKTLMEKKLSSKDHENTILKQQAESIKQQLAAFIEETSERIKNKKNEKEKFSIIKWLFDDEDISKKESG